MKSRYNVNYEPWELRHFPEHRFWPAGRSAEGLPDCFPIGDIHVSLLSRKSAVLLTRALGGARQINLPGYAAHTMPLGGSSCHRRTGHPFAVSGPCGSSQKVECVFSASPKTIRREPLEYDLRRSVGSVQADDSSCGNGYAPEGREFDLSGRTRGREQVQWCRC